MKILLTGASGQLGNELYPLLSKFGDVTVTDRGPAKGNMANWAAADLGDAGQLEKLLNRTDPDLIVNTAAYTAVDRAEEEKELAFLVNGEVPSRIASWAARNDRALLHYSTDYVFDGSSDRPYLESDEPSPLNIYGESKLAGELAIAASGCRGIVIRTSWVYSAHGNNFVLSMLKLGRRMLHLNVVDDQVGRPTWARNLAQASLELIRKEFKATAGFGRGVYHYSDRDIVSWYDFAALVFDTAVELGLLEQAPALSRITSKDYPQAATRPRYSVLNTSGIERHTGVDIPSLRESLRACMQEIVIDEK